MAQGMTTNLSIGLRQGVLDYTSDLHKKQFARLRPLAGWKAGVKELARRAGPLGELGLAWPAALLAVLLHCCGAVLCCRVQTTPAVMGCIRASQASWPSDCHYGSWLDSS